MRVLHHIEKKKCSQNLRGAKGKERERAPVWRMQVRGQFGSGVRHRAPAERVPDSYRAVVRRREDQWSLLRRVAAPGVCWCVLKAKERAKERPISERERERERAPTETRERHPQIRLPKRPPL